LQPIEKAPPSVFNPVAFHGNFLGITLSHTAAPILHRSLHRVGTLTHRLPARTSVCSTLAHTSRGSARDLCFQVRTADKASHSIPDSECACAGVQTVYSIPVESLCIALDRDAKEPEHRR